jgi:putative oxidoreductase
LEQRLASWEPYARSIMRIILAFVFSLHGYRVAFGMLSQVAGRGRRMPLDQLPHFTGYIAVVVGALLFAGLLTRLAALILSLQALAAYVFIAAPRAAIPFRAGANEVLLYCFVFLYLAFAGGGNWSLDHIIQKWRSADAATAAA